MIPKKPLLLAVAAALSLLATSACTATSATTTPAGSSAPPVTASPTVTTAPTVTPSSTPTPTLDAEQAEAVDVVERYSEAMAKIRANPSKYDQYKMIEVLKPLAFDDMIQANLNGIRPWRVKGWHAEGSVATVSTTASIPTEIAGGSRQVVVTVCRDQRGLKVVDEKGKTVTAEAAQFPDYLQNSYEMRKTASSGSFKLWELAGKTVEGCES